ncbi:Sensor protein SrrB [compost metagenome]
MLINLLNNAMKFTQPEGRIVTRAWIDGARLVCEVTDTGIGIAPEDLNKLFERFSQLESGKAKASGSGLGLSISKSLVEAHGGAIGVRSDVGIGSTFWFSLPLVAPAEACDRAEP